MLWIMRSACLLILMTVVSSGFTVACDATGSEMSIVNESGQRLVVRVQTDSGTYSKAVPGRTAGTLFNAFGTVRDTSIVVVFDALCERLAEIPFQNGGHVHVGADAAITMEPWEWRGATGVSRAALADQSCP